MTDLSWREFERPIGELFRKRDFSVKESDRAGPDGSVDIELRRDRELFLIARVAKRGPQAGKRFRGCSAFPACPGDAGGD